MSKIDIHADDFGESRNASRDIISCLRAGKLNSISILSNMSCFEDCVKLYREAEADFPKKPKLSVHLNLMEGKCMADPADVPNLVDENGHFCVSWGKLFLQSYLPGRDIWKNQIKKEIQMQIEAVRTAFPEMKKLRIDSHQHTHMIPVVLDALLEILGETRWSVEYIRNSKEPIEPFLLEVSLYSSFRPVNFIKNLILNYCAFFLERKTQGFELESMYLWGLIMSGHMDLQRVEKMFPAMNRKAMQDCRTLEILFHPGLVQKAELTEEFSQEEAIAFYVSEERHVEMDAVLKFSPM